MSAVATEGISTDTRIYALEQDDNNRAIWSQIDTVTREDHPGVPEAVLSAWFDDHDPLPGTYRAERAGFRAVILHWPGAQAA